MAMSAPADHQALDREHHNLIAEHYERLIVEPRRTLNNRVFAQAARFLPTNRASMLDLGAGTGHMTRRFGHLFGHATLVDHSAGMLERARAYTEHMDKKRSLHEAEAFEFLARDTQRHDLITCVGFLHHLEPDALHQMMKALVARLNPQGRIMLAEPVATTLPEPLPVRWWNRPMQSHIREYLALAPSPDEAPLDPAMLRAAFESAGCAPVFERRGWELFERFQGDWRDRWCIGLLDRVMGREGVVWVGVLALNGDRPHPA